MDTLEQRAQAGAEFLDENIPGWEERVNPNRLIMNDCLSCVLGQLYGDFDVALDELDMTYEEATNYGFFLDINRGFFQEYTELTEIWRDLIRSRSET